MEWYILLNTEPQEKIRTDFEKYFFKLMNNSVFGKSVEKVKNRINAELAVEAKCNKDLINKPQFCGETEFNDKLAAMHMSKTRVLSNKPI